MWKSSRCTQTILMFFSGMLNSVRIWVIFFISGRGGKSREREIDDGQ